jgi:hypothetical protein
MAFGMETLIARYFMPLLHQRPQFLLVTLPLGALVVRQFLANGTSDLLLAKQRPCQRPKESPRAGIRSPGSRNRSNKPLLGAACLCDSSFPSQQVAYDDSEHHSYSEPQNKHSKVLHAHRSPRFIASQWL